MLEQTVWGVAGCAGVGEANVAEKDISRVERKVGSARAGGVARSVGRCGLLLVVGGRLGPQRVLWGKERAVSATSDSGISPGFPGKRAATVTTGGHQQKQLGEVNILGTLDNERAKIDYRIN